MPYSQQEISALIKAYDVRGTVPAQINSDIAFDIGYIFAGIMGKEGARRVVIGHDMRPSSPELSLSFARGVKYRGLDVIHVGLVSTDGLYFSSGAYDCPGAMFTASHNPAQYNGIKLCRAGAKPVGQDSGLAEISAFLTSSEVDALSDLPIKQKVQEDADDGIDHREILDEYAQHMIKVSQCVVDRPLTVVIDAGNGMAGLTAPTVFSTLTNVKYIPMYFELDGTFPNHEANPLDPQNIVDLQRRVIAEKADLGLAFDGDADRCFFVDEKGNAISPSAVTALVAQRELNKHPGATILYNLITSQAVPQIVAEHGGNSIRTRVGHSFIKQTMAKTGAVFGGEHSAHYYFSDFFGADSGMLAALHVISAVADFSGTVSELMSLYSRFAQSGEINSTVDDADAVMKKVLDAFADRVSSTDDLDGVTAFLHDGSWFNLRKSNTEPLLRLNAEGPTSEAVSQLVEEVLSIIRQP